MSNCTRRLTGSFDARWWTVLSMLAVAAGFPRVARAQSDTTRMMNMAEHAMADHMDPTMMRHMEFTPQRPATQADSARATKVVAELKRAIAKYEDTSVAVADGYRMFLPNLRNQRVYHFTNYAWGFMEVFRFNPARPTSLLYRRDTTGALRLIGAMYTAPKRTKLSRLDDRIPVSVGRWHKHVNWCVPKKGDQARWTEQKDGHPVFGPASPIATKAECDAVHGDFHDTVFGWMIHANVYDGKDLATIFAP